MAANANDKKYSIQEVLNRVFDEASEVLNTSGSGGSGGTSTTDEATFTFGTTGVNPLAGVYTSTPDSVPDGKVGALAIDQYRNLLTRETYAPGFEDNVNNVAKVEQRFTPTMVTSDTAIKSSAGFLHSITFACNDSAPTAGHLTVYDNTAASGTKIFECEFTTTYFLPFSLPINVSFANGLYADFTTTADVNVTFSWR